jgi:hypothetical protein
VVREQLLLIEIHFDIAGRPANHFEIPTTTIGFHCRRPQFESPT